MHFTYKLLKHSLMMLLALLIELPFPGCHRALEGKLQPSCCLCYHTFSLNGTHSWCVLLDFLSSQSSGLLVALFSLRQLPWQRPKESPSLREEACLPAGQQSPHFCIHQLCSLGQGPWTPHFVWIPGLREKDNNPHKRAVRMNELIFFFF